MENFKGDIIEESLENKEVLGKVKIVSTRVEQVVEKHETPWLKQWTLHFVEVTPAQAREVAEKISASLETKHPGAWYADFKNETHHYIIFPSKVFFIDRSSMDEYNEATKYGVSLGIPKHQVDFAPNVIRWER